MAACKAVKPARPIAPPAQEVAERWIHRATLEKSNLLSLSEFEEQSAHLALGILMQDRGATALCDG
jgi:hypothetical protein